MGWDVLLQRVVILQPTVHMISGQWHQKCNHNNTILEPHFTELEVGYFLDDNFL